MFVELYAKWEAWHPVLNKLTLAEAVTFAAKILSYQSLTVGACGR